MGRAIVTAIGVLTMVAAGTAYCWTSTDIGPVSVAGSAMYDPNTDEWTLQSDGLDIWGSSDAFHYVYKYLKGDGSLTARVISIGGPGTDAWRKAGVMMREELTDNSRHVMMAMTPTEGHSAALQFRYFIKDQYSGSFHGGSYPLPYWVRIVREGDTFTGYISSDGENWQQQGYSLYIEMRDDRQQYAGCYIGLCLTSHEEGTLASATFDSVSFTGNVTDVPPPILKAWNPRPADGAIGVNTPELEWTCGDAAEWHDVYFGTDPNLSAGDFITRQDDTVYLHADDLAPETTYYWRIDEIEANESVVYTGDVWSFTTAEPNAWNPDPVDGFTFVDPGAALTWSHGTGAATHDVYLGTDEVAVRDGTAGTFKGNQADSIFDPCALELDTEYYWRVDEVGADGTTIHKGEVWSFKTRPRMSSYKISASSYIGGSDANDSVRGCGIQSDGTVVLAANIGDAAPGSLEPILLNDANESSSGAIIRLSADGTTVLSVTRLADLVLDLAVDGNDNLYVALWTEGMVKLDPSATSVLWSKKPETGGIIRLDVGPTGYCVTLKTLAAEPDTRYPGQGEISVYDSNGAELGTFPGYRRTFDVCIDEASQTVVHTGWRQAHVPISGWPDNGAVQIAYIQGRTYTGDVLWTGYDWSVYPDSERYLNRSDNNMADTRGLRCCIGRDGKLYWASIFHGGIHMQRYDPFDIMEPVPVVGGDMWFETWNTGNIHEVFVGRYEPATGEYLLGQQFTCRLADTKGNTVTVDAGAICADELGRVYVGGRSAWGLPLPEHPGYAPSSGQVAFNPLSSDYLGGAWLLVLSPDFKTRLYCTRLTFDQTHAVAARALPGGSAQIVFGGYSTSELYTKAAVQKSLQGGQDGWFAVIPPEQVPSVLYVDSRAPGNNDGTSWTDAFHHLQDALCAAFSMGDANEVRVARGTYTPDMGTLVTPGDRAATFQLVNGITVKGGYAGFGAPDPNARDIEAFRTVLSGDLNGDDLEVSDPCDLPNEPTRAENTYHVVTGSGTDGTAILDGFIITGGYAYDVWPPRGGGLYNQEGSPTLIDCRFEGSSAESGGGVHNYQSSSPRLVSCVFKNNYALYQGGGMSNWEHSSPEIANCAFSGNSALDGGGVANLVDSSPIVTSCTFSENLADRWGGGMHNEKGSAPKVTDCAFISNSAWRGGGIRNKGNEFEMAHCVFSRNSGLRSGGGMSNANCTLTVANCIFRGNWAGVEGAGGTITGDSNALLAMCVFTGNSAGQLGGGLFFSSGSRPTLANCIFSGNSSVQYGGGIHNEGGDAILANCTFAQNLSGQGGGMYCWGSTAEVNNSIFWANADGSGAGEFAQIRGCSPTVAYSCIQDDNPYDTYIPFGGASNNNIDDNPVFVRDPNDGGDGWGDDPATPEVDEEENDDYGDLHLQSQSPCINAGDPSFTAGPNDVDMDGQPRIIGSRVDIGADEFVSTGDLDLSGSVDLLDFAIFATQWWRSPTFPSADIAPDGGDHIVDFRDLAELADDWLAGAAP